MCYCQVHSALVHYDAALKGISERMLSQTLQWLEADGMVHRHVYNTVPPHVEYTLTPLGREAAEKVRDLADWIEVNLPAILQEQTPLSAENPLE